MRKFRFDLFFGRSVETLKPFRCSFSFAQDCNTLTDDKTSQRFQNTSDRKHNNGMLLLHQNSPDHEATFYQNKSIVLQWKMVPPVFLQESVLVIFEHPTVFTMQNSVYIEWELSESPNFCCNFNTLLF